MHSWILFKTLRLSIGEYLPDRMHKHENVSNKNNYFGVQMSSANNKHTS